MIGEVTSTHLRSSKQGKHMTPSGMQARWNFSAQGRCTAMSNVLGKKILEWSESPEKALEIAICLNN